MIKVNLVPREILDREVQRLRVKQASAAGGAALAGLVVVSLMHWYTAVRLDRKLKELNQSYDKLSKIVGQVEDEEKKAAAVKTRLGAVNGLLKGRALYPYFMSDLVATMPPGVWLTSLTTAPAPKDNTLKVTIGNATANSSDGLSQWLRNFAAASAKFDEPKLSAVSVSDTGDSKQYKFSITTGYKNPNL